MSSEDTKERSSARSAIIAIVVGVSITAITAVFGYMWSYWDGIRKDKLEFTNEQIEKLYGPLHALAQGNGATWKRFSNSECAPKWDNPSKEQITCWRVWIKNVFQPMNLEMEKTIVSNSQLVIGNQLPPVFQEFIEHTEAYKALISMWKDTDINDLGKYLSHCANSVDPVYPERFDQCVGPLYDNLKKRQEALQNHIFSYIFNDIFLGSSDSPSPSSECDDMKSAASERP
jgi:hypothetical protein